MDVTYVRNPSELSQLMYIILQIFEDISKYNSVIEDYFREYNNCSSNHENRNTAKHEDYKQLPIYGLTAEMIANIIMDNRTLYLKNFQIDEKHVYSALQPLSRQKAVECIDKHAYIKNHKENFVDDKGIYSPDDKREIGDGVCGCINFYIKGEEYEAIFYDVVEELADRFGIVMTDGCVYNNEDTTQIISDSQKNRINVLYSKWYRG